MRKQRRQAELQDKRDRIRMGLIPPDPPKGTFCPVCVYPSLTGSPSATLQPDESSHLRRRARPHSC